MITAAFFAVLCSAMAGPAPSSEDLAAANRYYGKLRALPFLDAPYERVEQLLEKLIELNPKRAGLYFHVGMVKIRHADVMSDEGKEMTGKLIRAIQRSGLPVSLVAKLIKSMRISYNNACGGGSGGGGFPDAGFTPTPTPTP
ncbi:MAG: hypothetical protein ACREKL_13505 [Chthoniobacterales bacterium]